MDESKLINLGRAAVDMVGVVAVLKNREPYTLYQRLVRRIGLVKEEYKLFVDYAAESECGRTFSSARATICWDTREERDAAYDKLVAALVESEPSPGVTVLGEIRWGVMHADIEGKDNAQ